MSDSSDNRDIDTQYNSTDIGVDADKIKQIIGKQIYNSATVPLDEMYNNGVTAIEDAIREGYMQRNESEICVTIEPAEESARLQIIDNGIGMTRSVIESVFSELGVSDSEEYTDTIGKFGQGVASYPNLTGFDDGLIFFETYSRKDDTVYEGYIQGIDTVHYRESSLEKCDIIENYGTGYELILRSDISVDTVYDWVDSITQYNTVNISVSRPTGNNVHSPYTYMDEFEKDVTVSFTIDNTLEVIAGPNVNSDSLLLYKPVEHNRAKELTDAPFKSNVFIRSLSDSQRVVTGEHKGKIVVDEDTPQNIDTNTYVRKSEVSNEVLSLSVVANRERFRENPSLDKYIAEKLKEKCYDKTESILSSIDSVDDVFQLSNEEQQWLKYAVSGVILNSAYQYNSFRFYMGFESKASLIQNLQELTTESYSLSNDTVKVLHLLFDDENIQSTSIRDGTPFGIEKKRRQDDVPVYMGVSIDPTKRTLAKEDEPNAVIVELKSAEYSQLENTLGWNKLKLITDNITDLDISQSLKQRYVDSSAKSTKDTNSTITIHSDRSQRFKTNLSVDEITTQLEQSDTEFEQPLVVFPTGSEQNLSNFYDYLHQDYSVCNCSQNEADKLCTYDTVYTISEMISQHKSTQIQTANNGTRTLESVLIDPDTIVLVTNTDFSQFFTDKTDLLTRLQTYCVQNGHIKEQEYSDIGLIQQSTIEQSRFAINEQTVELYTINIGCTEDLRLPSEPQSLFQVQDFTLLAHIALIEWSNTPYYTELCSNITNYSNPVEMISAYRTALQNGSFKTTDDLYNSPITNSL